MSVYNYLLFRLYTFYDKKEKDSVLFSVTAASTVIVYISLFTIYALFDYLNIVKMFPNKYYVIPIMIGLGFLNYYVFVRNKRFLTYDFKKSLGKDLMLIIGLLLILTSFIIIANKNRAKIKKQNLNSNFEKVEKRPSLEGKIRKWFDDK